MIHRQTVVHRPNVSDGPTGFSQGFRRAYSAETLELAAQVAIRKLTELLDEKRVEGLRLQDPKLLTAQARSLMTTAGDCAEFNQHRFAQILDLYLRTCIRVNSTGYMGRQFSSVIPISAVFDMVTAMCPQPASFYEAGQLANVADKILAEEFRRLLGWTAGSGDMIVTSGGSLANLTAILAARNDRLAGSWSTGVAKASRQVPMIAVSEDIHYSVDRVAGITGIGQEGVLRLPLDGKRRICLSRAESILSKSRAAGGEVFCIVASAGSTSIGAIDPLDGLADLAQAHRAWLHVDGSHSGAFLVSERLRPRLRGIERADSFCLDAHKTLFVPALCTLLFYRDCAKARQPFSQEASYVFDDHQDPMALIESGGKNFECTKRPAVLNLWLVWAMYGPRAIADKLEYLVDLTREAYDYLSETPDFYPVHEPESNILCFQHRPKEMNEEHISALQLALRDRIRNDGKFFLSKVEIGGRNVLRMVLMNHEITIDHIADLVVEIRRAAHSILQMPDWPAIARHGGPH